MEREQIDPKIQAIMDAWDRRTGRTSRETSGGPLSAELRRKISDGLTEHYRYQPTASLFDLHRRRISAGYRARQARMQRPK